MTASDKKSELLPLVSVHIITYNQKHFIHKTLQSVLEQDYENIEIVVADDGSTDGTAEIIMDFAKQYPCKIVPLVGGRNLGITGNSNRGLAACNGKYIAFLGGDDLMLPNKLNIQVKYMESHPKCSICYHDLEVFDNETGKALYLFNEINKPYSGRVSGIIKRGTVNGGSSTMVRRESVPSHGFEASIPVASDWLFWIETLISHNQEIHFINQVLGRYRRHSRNVTQLNIGEFNQCMQDQLATAMRVLFVYPEYANDVLYRLGTILRGLRFTREYRTSLISSLRCSFQLKTILLLMIYSVTFGLVRR